MRAKLSHFKTFLKVSSYLYYFLFFKQEFFFFFF